MALCFTSIAKYIEDAGHVQFTATTGTGDTIEFAIQGKILLDRFHHDIGKFHSPMVRDILILLYRKHAKELHAAAARKFLAAKDKPRRVVLAEDDLD